MNSKIFLITILLYPVINTPILAFPSLDKTVGVHSLTNYAPYILRDDKDENLFYLPFTRIAIAGSSSNSSSDNQPDFSFLYLPAGLIIQLTVQVSIDQAGLLPLMEKIKAKNPNARFRYLPVDSGRFMPTLRSNMGVDSYPKSQTDFNIAHNNPRQKRQMSFFFSPAIADLIVLSITNGGGFAINYEYQYRASLTPTSARVKIHWGDIDQFIGTNAPTGTPVSPTGINTLVREMSANQSISIQLVGDSGHLAAIIKRITAFIRDSCFKPVPAGFEKRQNGCENKQAELFYQTAPIEELTALAGFQLPGMCFSHPEHFSFMGKDGQFVKGCPDSIYGGGDGGGLSVLSKKPTLQRSEIPEPESMGSDSID